MLKSSAAALLALLPATAFADALIDNVNGVTMDKKGKVIRFNGLTMSTDGKVTALLTKDDRRPARGRLADRHEGAGGAARHDRRARACDGPGVPRRWNSTCRKRRRSPTR